MSTATSRRSFLRHTAAGAGAVWVTSLQNFATLRAHASHTAGSPYLLREDNSGATLNEAERRLGLTPAGQVYEFAENDIVLSSALNSRIGPGDYRQNEWAGAC